MEAEFWLYPLVDCVFKQQYYGLIPSSTDLSFVIGILSLNDSLFFSKISNADVFWLSAYCAIRFHLVIPGEVLCNNGYDMILSEFISNF